MIKPQLGPRVDVNTYDALKRLAAAAGSSLGPYCARVLMDHVTKQQRGGGAIDFEEALRDLERRIGEQHDRQKRDARADKRDLERNLDAVKAMIEAAVETFGPETHGAYVKAVERILRGMGVQVGQVAPNGSVHE